MMFVIEQILEITDQQRELGESKRSVDSLPI